MSERPPAEPQPPAPGDSGVAAAPDRDERAGALIVERIRKDDGRALIAYWHEREQA